MLLAGAALDKHDGFGMSPLLIAASSLDPQNDDKTGILQQLLSAGASVQDMCPAGRTALHYAAQWGGADAVQLLLQAGADVAAVDAKGLTPLSYAVLHPLWAGEDAPVLLDMLFAAGASVSEINACDRHSENALRKAASRSCELPSSAYLHALVSAGLDMNAANEYGWTPLHNAVGLNRVSKVIDLLSLGAAADIPDVRGKTALYLAARRAAKYPSGFDEHPWVLIFKAFLKHHSTAPFAAASLVVAVAAAAKPSRRIETPAELENQRAVVEQLLVAAVQQDLVDTHAALQQHWPESWQAAVLVTGLLLDVWSAAAADLMELEAGLPAVQQMVVRVAAEQADSSAAQEQQHSADDIAALELS
jgi:ankyrin repeat protein